MGSLAGLMGGQRACELGGGGGCLSRWRGGRALGGFRLTVYVNPPPTHTSQNKVSREHRDRDREQRLWNGEHWQLRPERQARARLLRGLESEFPPLTSCVTLGSFSNVSVLQLHFSKI